MRKSNLKAFTVLETIITLFISSMLILIGSLKMHSYENQLLLVNTEKQAKTAIEQAARVSAIKHEEVNVMYMSNESYIQFKGEEYSKRLKINKRVRLSKPMYFRISRNGAVSPRTINFYLGQSEKKLKLQMMWGKAIDS